MKKKTFRKQSRYVLVTDALRGIVWGELIKQDPKTRTCVLKNARHCFCYTCHPEAKGILGLATKGPQTGSKVGPLVDRHELFYEKITDCTAEANQAWLDATWA